MDVLLVGLIDGRIAVGAEIDQHRFILPWAVCPESATESAAFQLRREFIGRGPEVEQAFLFTNGAFHRHASFLYVFKNTKNELRKNYTHSTRDFKKKVTIKQHVRSIMFWWTNRNFEMKKFLSWVFTHRNVYGW